MINLAYLSLGANLGDRVENLREAVRQLRSVGTIMAASALYETEPVDFTEQPWFLNAVVALQTGFSPLPLLREIAAIESSMGRQRMVPKGPRTIDIDILLYGTSIVDDGGLEIPHPAMHLRRFVLQPLVEIAPDCLHPVLGKTALQLLNQLEDRSSVRRISGQIA